MPVRSALMEISARVLREVEFNSSLRGYNTDEVDEFLEQVADAVDRLREEAKVAADRAEAAEHTARDRTGLEDEESIRRTLVLAQRTADLAIREAQEEAGVILDRARSEAETLVGDARDSALRITSEAEKRLRDEVARLSGARDDLRKEVDMLVSLLGAERERLIESLGAALGYVERSLAPSTALLAIQPTPSRGAAGSPAGDGHGDLDQPEPLESGEDSPVGAATAGAATSGPGAGPDAGKSGAPTAGSGASTGSSPEGAGTSDAEPGTSETATATATVHAEPPKADKADKANKADKVDKADGDEKSPPEVDDLEAAIAEDAAKAAPTSSAYPRQSEPDQYDWDSVIRGRPEPVFSDRGRADRPNLTALPSLDEPSQDTAAMELRTNGADWPA